MAFFKFRKGGDDSLSTHGPAESVEVMRRRARHRLIGAAVLVLVGVVGFPLLFDTQPRPIQVDIPIDIPDRNKARPLATAPAPAASTQAAATPEPAPAAPPVVAAVTPAPARITAPPARVAASASLSPREEVVAARTELNKASGLVTPAPAVPAKPEAKPRPEPKAEPKPEPKTAKPEPKTKPEPKPEPKHEAKPEPKAAAKPDDGARAKALLEGKPVEVAAPAAAAAATAEGRFVVQVGAFADATKARETRLKVEKTGLKTYTQISEGREGKRIRVRVGPFGSRAEADKAAAKIKGLDLPASILTL